MGHALSLDISSSLVHCGLPRAEFAFFSSEKEGQEAPKKDISPDAQGAQGLLGDVTGPSRIRWKLGLNSRSMLVLVLRFLSQPSSAALGDPGPASGCPQACRPPRGGMESFQQTPSLPAESLNRLLPFPVAPCL